VRITIRIVNQQLHGFIINDVDNCLSTMYRLELLSGHIASGKNSLTIKDGRTDKTYEVPITDGFVKGSDLQKIVENGKVLRSYDPGYMNTILCTSKISYIDGDKGILEYRGYPIE
jgi:citrate synthase